MRYNNTVIFILPASAIKKLLHNSNFNTKYFSVIIMAPCRVNSIIRGRPRSYNFSYLGSRNYKGIGSV